ncbi:MAG: mechanosensitive ion channel family protein [Deltaproteobacteria bacterium]|nr:mechanosensitive ion channel family protein [Deltaproteobacteria bacterium]MBW2136015.1 mechanosensitive ion channel family protein [Deltaproteobacteria bacterium]
MDGRSSFDQLWIELGRFLEGSESWRFWMTLILLVVGFILVEILWRRFNRYAQKRFERKGVEPGLVNLVRFLPAFRLAIFALFLRLLELILVLSPRLLVLFHALEAIILAMAAILFLFSLVGLLDTLRIMLPQNIQDAVPEDTVAKVKGSIRMGILCLAAIGFIYSQKEIFPEWLWRYAWWRYLLMLVVLAVVYMIGKLLVRSLSSMAAVLKESQEKLRLRLVLQASIWPVRLILATIVLHAAREIFLLDQAVGRIIEMAAGVMGTLAVVLFVYRLLDVLEYELTRYAEREETPVDRTFVQMVRLFARVIVIVVGSVYLIRAISGKPLSTLVAGLGIGGLAIALASQDTLKNFFGSIMIMLDKPFSVGQRVTVEGYDGTVESIGFRSTRIRTLTGHLVTIPNEKMASANIENIGRRPSIRRLSNITITYDTPPEKVERAVEIIREILKDHEGMHPDYPPRVHFNEFNDTSLNILMIYWYHPPDYWDFIAFNEKVNMQIMKAFEREGIEFAFPTVTNFLAHDERRPLRISLEGLRDNKDVPE